MLAYTPHRAQNARRCWVSRHHPILSRAAASIEGSKLLRTTPGEPRFCLLYALPKVRRQTPQCSTNYQTHGLPASHFVASAMHRCSGAVRPATTTRRAAGAHVKGYGIDSDNFRDHFVCDTWRIFSGRFVLWESHRRANFAGQRSSLRPQGCGTDRGHGSPPFVPVTALEALRSTSLRSARVSTALCVSFSMRSLASSDT